MGAGNTSKLTKRTVDAVKPGQIVWDSEVKGFGVRCQRRDKVYILKARARGRWRWFTIGPHGSPWTVEKARTEALRILGQIADKKDPAAIRDAEKTNPTVAELAKMFLRDHVEAKRKSRTADSYRDLLERLVNPVLGKTRVVDVSRSDVAKLHHSLRATPYQANRTLAVLSKMFNWAEQIGYRPDGTNPCLHVEKYRERKRERFLSEAEHAALGETLLAGEGKESPYVLAAIRLLIFTGARLGEILSLKWENADFEKAVLRLPDSKTGEKTIYLSAPALEVLSSLPRLEKNPYVICGDKPGAHLVNLEKAWRRIRERVTLRILASHPDEKIPKLLENLLAQHKREPSFAECVKAAKAKEIELPKGLSDVRLHDLRHSFASVAASGGLSLPMIGKLLGHTQAQTTHRYAHLAADPIRAANEAIGERIAAVMKQGAKESEVIELPRKA